MLGWWLPVDVGWLPLSGVGVGGLNLGGGAGACQQLRGGSYHAVVRLFTSVGGGGVLATRKRGPATFWGSHNTSKRAGDRDTLDRVSF